MPDAIRDPASHMGERMLNKRFVNFITSSTWSIFVLATALCIVWLLAGCAGMQARPEPRWGCSPEADAAVEKGDWEAAREAHETLLDQTPDNCLALYHLGYIWGRLGSRDEEIAHYHKAEACGYVHDGQLYFNLGMALADINDIDGAISRFRTGRGPGSPECGPLFRLGAGCPGRWPRRPGRAGVARGR